MRRVDTFVYTCSGRVSQRRAREEREIYKRVKISIDYRYFVLMQIYGVNVEGKGRY